jgi:hypothetical protein
MKKSPFSPSPFLADFVDNLSILDITKQLGSRGGEEGRWREEGRDGDGGRKGGRESERERERIYGELGCQVCASPINWI